MVDRLEKFLAPLKDTHFSLGDYVDFEKVGRNVESISIKLNQLNYLIGQPDMEYAVRRLWHENPGAFSVLDVLIAVRSKDMKKALDKEGNICIISDFFKSPEQVMDFLDGTVWLNCSETGKLRTLWTMYLAWKSVLIQMPVKIVAVT